MAEENQRSPLFILFLVVLIDMIGFTLVIPFLTYFVQDLAKPMASLTWDLGLVGWNSPCIYTLGQFLFTPLLGSLSDRIGRRPILMFGLLCNTIFLISFGLASALWMAIAVRFLAGAGNGNIAVTRAILGTSAREQLPARMGMIGASFGLGFMIGPFVGGILTDPASTFRTICDRLVGSTSILLAVSNCRPPFAVSFILAIRMLPESLPKERGAREKESTGLKV